MDGSPREDSLRLTFTKLGILEPVEALEVHALELARTLDAGVDDKALASVSREYRLTLEKIESQPRETPSDADRIEDKY
jgi:hypothetical protein